MSNEIVEKVKTILTKSEISFELVEGVFHFPLDLENVKLSRIQVELAVAADSIVMHSCLGVNAPRGRFSELSEFIARCNVAPMTLGRWGIDYTEGGIHYVYGSLYRFVESNFETDFFSLMTLCKTVFEEFSDTFLSIIIGETSPQEALDALLAEAEEVEEDADEDPEEDEAFDDEDESLEEYDVDSEEQDEAESEDGASDDSEANAEVLEEDRTDSFDEWLQRQTR